MRTHTQFKKLLARVLVSLTFLTAVAQVTVVGQSTRPMVVAVPPNASASVQPRHLLRPGTSNAERFAVSPSQTKRHGIRAVAQGNAVSFLPAVTYASGGSDQGGGVASAAVGDMNGDGKPDLIVPNFSSNTVGLLLGNGDGTFQPVVTFNPGVKNPTAIAIADFNGDGNPDLVVGSWPGGVGVLLGVGDGTFRPAVKYGSGGVQVSDVVVADVNHDGKADLIVANYGSVLGVLLGNGDGTFRRVVKYGGGGTNPWSVAVADVNGDDNPDLLVADLIMNTVAVVLGNGDGTFKPAVTYGSGGAWAESIAVADVNGDNKPDLVVANCGTNDCPGEGLVAILLGNGDGTFQGAVPYDSGGALAQGVTIAEVDGDGKPDLLLVNTFSNNVGVLLGNGDGTFQPAVTFGSGAEFPGSIIVADVNGDGKPDLVVTNQCSPNCDSQSVGVLLNNSTLGKSATSTSITSSLNPSIYGQAVTWTAMVTTSGTVTPTGKVKFTWDGHTIGTAMLNASGVATLTKSNLNADTFPLMAVYSGDAANLGSTSAVLNQVVTQTSSAATLTSSPNPSIQGQAVTFTATIASPTVKPMGPVTFTTGKTVWGTAQLSNGKAKLTISSLPVGSTKVTATYYGDSNIAKSSTSVMQTVQ